MSDSLSIGQAETMNHRSEEVHTSQRPSADFVHPAEKALADLFEKHGIRWRYEPHVFDLEHDWRGRIIRAFKPDFYLPDLDLYVECTMMKQSRTNRKNRKARDAERKHGIVVVIFYRRDFERLHRQHGLDLAAASRPFSWH
jgi:hypothetical protein